MRNCGQRNFRKHKETKDSDERVTLNMYDILNISEKFEDLDKIETTSSESKVKTEESGSKIYKKARYAIGNVRMKDLSYKIKEFEKIVKVPYLKSTPNMNPL